MAAIRKRGRWYFRKRVRGHGRIFVNPADYGLPNTKIAAEEAGRRRVAELHGERKPLAVPSKSPILTAFVPVFIEHSEARNEYSSVKAKRQILRDHIEKALGHLPLDQVTYARIEDFKNRLRVDLSAKTVNNILTVLRRLLVLAVKRGELAHVPEIEWLPTNPSKFDFLTFEESDSLLESTAPDWHSMVLVAVRCGLRQGELLGLKWDHVDLKLNRLRIQESIVRGRTKGTKSRRHRTVDLGAEVALALAKHKHLRGPYVFCDADGAPLTSGACKWPLWTACEGAGLRRIGWHVLRHTFCSQLAMRGASPQVIQKLAGHATLKMTERYMHLSPNVTQDAVRLLDRGAHLVPNKTRSRGTGR
jgi:integrase